MRSAARGAGAAAQEDRSEAARVKACSSHLVECPEVEEERWRTATKIVGAASAPQRLEAWPCVVGSVAARLPRLISGGDVHSLRGQRQELTRVRCPPEESDRLAHLSVRSLYAL